MEDIRYRNTLILYSNPLLDRFPSRAMITSRQLSVGDHNNGVLSLSVRTPSGVSYAKISRGLVAKWVTD